MDIRKYWDAVIATRGKLELRDHHVVHATHGRITTADHETTCRLIASGFARIATQSEIEAYEDQQKAEAEVIENRRLDASQHVAFPKEFQQFMRGVVQVGREVENDEPRKPRGKKQPADSTAA